MTDIAPTASNVKLISGQKKVGIAGVAVTAGQVLYKEAAGGALKLVDADSATAEARVVEGIALNGAAVDQPVAYAFEKDSVVAFGAVLTKGTSYISSPTAGGLRPAADLGASEYHSQVGVAISTSQLKLSIFNSGVTL